MGNDLFSASSAQTGGPIMAVTLGWSPNSWFEIAGPDVLVQIDPAIPPSAPYEVEGDPTPADLVLITHHHPDHCDPAMVERIAGADTPVYAPRLAAERLGSRTEIVKAGDVFDAAGVHVEVVEAYNTEDGSSTNKSHVRGEGVGYVVTIGDLRIYHAGDTDLIPEMADLDDIDVALLPVGGTYTMDATEAAEAALLIDPGIAIPMHPRDTNPEEFRALLEESDIEAVVLTADEELDVELDAGD
jgi:L-ascorbate metabolism protein UlaG (beta-lactamase superfamily)